MSGKKSVETERVKDAGERGGDSQDGVNGGKYRGVGCKLEGREVENEGLVEDGEKRKRSWNRGEQEVTGRCEDKQGVCRGKTKSHTMPQ